MEYKPAVQSLIKRQQRAAIAWVINLQIKNFFHGETNKLSKFVLMKNNICARNPLIYHAEVPIALYGEDSPPKSGETQVV